MAIAVRIDHNKREATLIVTERFTLEQHRAFTAAYRSLEGQYAHCILDLYRLEYLDVAALGMLLRLKEHLDSTGALITLLVRPGQVLEIIRIASFDRLFSLEVA